MIARNMAHMGGANGSMPTLANIEVERHVRQNNERLRCIQRHLQTPDGFDKAAKELLEWCSDQRAFQKAFEQSLMNCLTVISEVAAKPGFNLSLGYRLLAICAANRDKFSQKSSGLLQYWCDELGKLLLLQHQKNRNNESMKPPTNPSPGPHGGHMGMNYPPGPMGPRMGYPDASGWNQGNVGPNAGPMSQRPQHHSVSVTTTVWGVTNTTQTPPIRGQSHPPINQYPSHMGPGSVPHPRPHAQGPGGYGYNQKPGSYGGPGHYQRQDSFGTGISGPHRPMHGPGYGPSGGGHQGHHMGGETGDYAPPAAAAAAAAVAAAAATATATATATLMVNDQQQQQNDMYDQMGQHRGDHMHPMDPNSMHPHGGSVPPGPGMRDPGPHSGMMGPGGRIPPRQGLPPQYGQPGRGMGPGPHPMGPSHHPASSPVGGPPSNSGGYNGMGPQYRPAFRTNSAPYGPSPYDNVPPNQFKSPPLGNHPNTPTPGFSPRIPTPSSQGPMLTATPDLYPSVSSANSGSQYYHNSQATPNPSGPHPSPGPMGYGPSHRPPYTPQYGQMFRGPQQPPNPMPGNPTPPLTPGSAHNVPPYPGPDVKPPLHALDVKPIIPTGGLPPVEDPLANQNLPPPSNDEMRMTFPVRDGIVLESFRLEHNRSVSTHAFQLREQAYQTLMWRSDLELQFKCYHHDDKTQYTNWPHSVQVTVNNTKMPIPRSPCKPLYLRDVCQPGRNTIEITVATCCCSHLFVLQLVHRPSVRSVLMGLLQKRMLPATHCVTKIKRYFTSGLIGNGKGMIGSPLGNGAIPNDDSNSVVVSLRCPITHRRINLPARGNECKHIQCFDLEAYLQLNSDKRTWRCPICKKSALLEGLEVDQYIWGILKESHPEDMEVTIDQRCVWKPVTVKRETFVDEQDGPPNKRFRSNGMSPASMFNHLPSPGSYVPQMTPLPPTARLTMTPDMNSTGGPGGFPHNTGGCGFSGGNSVFPGGGPSLTNTPCPSAMNGAMGGPHMGMPGDPSSMNSMGVHMNSIDSTLQRANPLQLENIAADDMVHIEKRLNHAVAKNHMASTTSPNRPMSNHPSTPGPNPLIRSNSHSQSQNGTFSQQCPPNADPRLRSTMSAPGNPSSALTPGTPGNPSTPGIGLSPSMVGGPQSNSNNVSMPGANVGPITPSGNMGPGMMGPSGQNTFDANAVINGSGLGEVNEKTLDILPDNTDPLELIDFLNTDATGNNDDDIFSMFDTN